ncbi:hypothetical protein [Pseudomonas protegens]|uniref:hypothetical protein n=1 Tax=Pseudomonas protegens TaxID=380021 RepID=UPI000E1FA49A|nr:hypothetical protein [Pseudomonas protegens]AXK54206.1 hypothetical protein DWF74_12895 [Pseudomonas protegens]
MVKFVKIKSKKGRELIVNTAFIVGIYPTNEHNTFSSGGMVLVHEIGKDGVNRAIELSKTELNKLTEALGV